MGIESKDLAQIIFRNQGPFPVNRQQLAKRLKEGIEIAKEKKLRPGQQPDRNLPTEGEIPESREIVATNLAIFEQALEQASTQKSS